MNHLSPVAPSQTSTVIDFVLIADAHDVSKHRGAERTRCCDATSADTLVHNSTVVMVTSTVSAVAGVLR